MKTTESMLKHRLPMSFQLYRFLWSIVWTLFAKPLPRSYFNAWKISLLRLFGAKIGYNAIVYSSAIVNNPKKLIMKKCAVLGPNIDCYNTERPEALEAGTVKLVGTNYDKIVSEVSLLLDDEVYYSQMSRAVNPYGDGLACERIVNELC